MRYPLVIFDFDGTLADSFPFFLAAQREIAKRHGFEAIAGERVDDMRRLGVREIMRELKCPPWKLPLVAADFVRAMQAAPPVPLFPGIADVLARLHAGGVHMAILTSNSVENVRRVLGESLADAIRLYDGGAHMLGKHRRLARMLAQAGTPAGQAIYIGDQLSDREAARRAGMAFGAVGWGYAHVDALRAARPEEFFESVEELTRLLA